MGILPQVIIVIPNMETQHSTISVDDIRSFRGTLNPEPLMKPLKEPYDIDTSRVSRKPDIP